MSERNGTLVVDPKDQRTPEQIAADIAAQQETKPPAPSSEVAPEAVLIEVRPFTVALVKFVADADERKRNFEHWADEMLVLGVTVWKQRQKNTQKNTNRREFDEEIGKNPQYYRDNPLKMIELMDKHGIGQSKK